MEPEAHRLDREALLADHRTVAERIRREVDEMVAVAAEKSRAYAEQVIDRMRADATAQPPKPASPPSDGEAARLLVAAARAAEEVREASRLRALQTLTRARERARELDAETGRQRAVLAEMQQQRERAEREAAELIERARAEADSLLAAMEEERRSQIENELAALHAETERERVALAALHEQRLQAEREADEIRARARAEAEGVVAAIELERRRVRELLSGAIASLDAGAGAGPDNLAGDLASRLNERRESPTP
jgi:hypothetical protein